MRPTVGLRLVERPAAVEAALWRRFKTQQDAVCRQRLFDRFTSMARAIAHHEFRRRPPYGLEKQDFEQLAYGGLLEAIDRFNPLRGALFEAFARPRIRGAISDGIAKSSESGAQYSYRRRVEMERLRSIGATSETADPMEELAALSAMLAIGLMAEASGAGGAPGGGSPNQLDGPSWREMQDSIRTEIDRLPPKECSIMRGHYLEGVAFGHLATVLNISKGRISQLHRAALVRLRKRLHATQ